MENWYYIENNVQLGPISKEQLQQLLSTGQVKPSSYVWTESFKDWKRASEVPGLIIGSPVSQEETLLKPVDGYEPQSLVIEPSTGRPTSVTVFGVLNIVFGTMALLCLPITMVMTFVGRLQAEMFTPAYRIFTMATVILGLPFAILELASGIGLLRLRRWARMGAIVFGAYSIISSITGVAVTLTMLLNGAAASHPEVITGSIGGIIGGIVGMIYPILLIIFMCRPAAVDSCVK